MMAINHCHAKNICHRDLKPENILIDENNVIKLIDFGTAGRVDPKLGISGLRGTSYYLAPEVLDESKSYNQKCDIWSMGVILFVLLTGNAPFNGKDDDKIYKAIKKGTYSTDGNIFTYHYI
jgi:calcium-dependent protein kinase